MSRAIRAFWVIVVAQVIFLLGWAGYHEWVRQHAAVIVVKGRPVDPRDLLRGDYMVLNYDISTVRLPGETRAAKEEMSAGTEVWVTLEKRGRYHEVVQANVAPPEVRPGQVLVRGNMGRGFRGQPGEVRVNYGIEQFFVPEGKGAPTFKLMEVELAVSAAHRLYIKRVLLDGTAYP